MATLIALGNLDSAAAGWQTVNATAENDSEAGNTTLTTAYVASTTFTPGAMSCLGIAVKINTRLGATANASAASSVVTFSASSSLGAQSPSATSAAQTAVLGAAAQLFALTPSVDAASISAALDASSSVAAQRASATAASLAASVHASASLVGGVSTVSTSALAATYVISATLLGPTASAAVVGLSARYLADAIFAGEAAGASADALTAQELSINYLFAAVAGAVIAYATHARFYAVSPNELSCETDWDLSPDVLWPILQPRDRRTAGAIQEWKI